MEGTILEVLTQPNPHLVLTYQKRGPLTKNPAYIKLEDPDISTSAWDDFTYQNIVAALGNLLDYGLVTSVIEDDIGGSQRGIETEEDVDRIGDHWIRAVIKGPLKYGSRRVLQQLRVEEDEHDMNELSFRLKGVDLVDPMGKKRFKPDWWMFQQKKPATNIVFGDSKCSTKWCSDTSRGLPSKTTDWIWPMRQIGTYCYQGETRYAFIMTPRELVVARFYLHQQNAIPSRVEIKSIPWEAGGSPNELTMNLALWALAMFALNKDHRDINSRDETLPLNLWWKVEDATGATFYEHHLTGRRLSTLPSGGEARIRPLVVKKPVILTPPVTPEKSAATGESSKKRARKVTSGEKKEQANKRGRTEKTTASE